MIARKDSQGLEFIRIRRSTIEREDLNSLKLRLESHAKIRIRSDEGECDHAESSGNFDFTRTPKSVIARKDSNSLECGRA